MNSKPITWRLKALSAALALGMAGAVFAGDMSRDEAIKALDNYTKAHETWMEKYQELMQSGKPEEEMKKAMGDLGRPPSGAELMDEAELVIEHNQTDNSAYQALKFITGNSGYEGEALEKRNKAVKLLMDNFIDREDILQAIGYMVGPMEEQMTVYNRIYEKSPHESVRAEAMLTRVQILARESGKPMDKKDRQALYDRATAATAIIAEKYADMTGTDPYRGTEFNYLESAEKASETIAEMLKPGNAIADFEIVDLEGKADKLSNYRGSYVLMDFWATWCGPCRAGMPGLVKLKESLQGEKFEIIGISADEEAQDVVSYKEEEQPMPWVHWHSGPEHSVLEDLEIDGFPTYILLDPKGNVISRTHYFDDSAKAYTRKLVRGDK